MSQSIRNVLVSGGRRVLLVNHGYPPLFNAGSEIYTQTVATHLRRHGAHVSVFSREIDPFEPDFQLRQTSCALDADVAVFLVNHARESAYGRFMNKPLGDAFDKVLARARPEVVHFGHLNHLSMDLPQRVKAWGASVVNAFTLHDFWLMCPRGQFIKVGVTENEPWQPCSQQVHGTCARDCIASRFASGVPSFDVSETEYWTDWVRRRMDAVRDMTEHVDVWLSPSKHLRQRFVDDFGLESDKVKYVPYGFDHDRLPPRTPRRSEADIRGRGRFVFGYIGRHEPSKGIHLLLKAATALAAKGSSDFQIVVFGRPNGATTDALRRIISRAGHGSADVDIQWRPEYDNVNIASDVFDHVDAIVVPSIWDENAPLVIHEALQARVPVITSDRGGMGELIRDGVNGLTFEHRSVDSLASTMARAIAAPDQLVRLSQRGYLGDADGNVPEISHHIAVLNAVYDEALSGGLPAAEPTSPASAATQKLPVPWRITFDTNPDDCNFSCSMCEQHSPYSPHQKARKAQGIRRRRMDPAIIRKTVAELAPLGLKEIIPSTMGEPLMYVSRGDGRSRRASQNAFVEIVEICHEYGVRLNLTTNGSFYGRGVDEWAKLILPVGSDVKISWNGATADTQESIMRGSNFAQQMQNLKSFVAHRDELAASGGNYCSITLQLTFMESNLNELAAIVKLGIEHNVDRIKGHQLWAHFEQLKDMNLRRSVDSIRRWNDVVDECHQLATTLTRPGGDRIRLENFTRIDAAEPVAQQEAQSDSEHRTAAVPADMDCPFLGQEAWVNPAGRFDPCCAPDAERRLFLGSFGSVAEHSLLDVWNSKQYDELLKSWRTNPLCMKCPLVRRKSKGGE